MHPTAVLIDRFRRTYLKVKEGPKHLHVVPMAGSKVVKLTPKDCEELALRELDYPLDKALAHFRTAAERFGMTAELGALLTRLSEDPGPPGDGYAPSAPPMSEGRERPVKGKRTVRHTRSEAEQLSLEGLGHGTAEPSHPKECAAQAAKPGRRRGETRLEGVPARATGTPAAKGSRTPRPGPTARARPQAPPGRQRRASDTVKRSLARGAG